MGQKALISMLVGLILLIVCGAISMVEYVAYLLQASFIGVLAGIGFVFGIFLILFGISAMSGDK